MASMPILRESLLGSRSGCVRGSCPQMLDLVRRREPLAPITDWDAWVGWSRMKFRKLGDSEIEVSEISLGSWLTFGAGVEREHTEACTRAAFDAGINFFDTANVYGGGAAETVWGEVLSDFDR